MADRSVVIRLIADTGSYEQGMRRAAGATEGLETAGRASIVTLGSLGRLAGGLLGGSLIAAGIEFDALKQRSQASFTTIMGSSRAAKVELADLYAQFKANPFGYPQILKSSQQLLAMGVGAKDLLRTVRDISDATAAVGGSADVFDRVALAFGQMKAKGTIQAEEMRQLAENGIPAWQLLAHEIGVSVPDAMKMVQRREVDSNQGFDALLRGIESKFGGATDNLKSTWTGTLQAFKAQVTATMGEVAEPIIRIATDAMHAVEPLTHQLGSLASGFAGLPNPVQNTTLALGAVMLLSGRLNSIWALTSTQLGTLRQTMALARVEGTLYGGTLGRLRAMMYVTAGSARVLGASMLSVFGGPIGIALIAATFGLSMYADAQAKAKAAAEAHDQAVQTLKSDLDHLTLSLTQAGIAAQDQAIASDKLGNSGKTVAETLRAAGINAIAYRNAIIQGSNSGWFTATTTAIEDQTVKLIGNIKMMRDYAHNTGASTSEIAHTLLTQNGRLWSSLKLTAGESEQSHAKLNALVHLYRYMTDKTGTLKESQKQLADAMALEVPDAAHQANVSVDRLSDAFDRWRAKGGNLKTVLDQAGFTSSQVSVILKVLAGDAMNAAYSFGNAASFLEKLRDDLAGTTASFVSIAGAWDSAKTKLQASMSGGGSGSGGGSSSAGDNPAVKAAKAAAHAFKEQADKTEAALKKQVYEAKVYEAAQSDKADAADKAAARAKKAWEAAKKAADDADRALDKARTRKAQADQDARDAANILAAVQHDQAITAGGPDTGAWARAHDLAAASAAATGAAAASAEDRLAVAQGKVAKATADKHSAYLTWLETHQRAVKADKDEEAAAKALERAQHHLEQVREQDSQRYQHLLDKQHHAEERAQRSAEQMAGGVSSAMGGLADDVEPSLQQYLDELDKQVQAQENWERNMIALSAKIPPGVAVELAKLGPAAAPLVQKLVTGTKAQLDQFVKDFPSSTKTGVNDIVTELTNGIPLIAAVGKTAGHKMAEKLAGAIQSGKTTVSDAIRALQAHMDKDKLEMKLGLSNKGDIERELDNLISDHVYKFKTITYRGSPAFVVQGIAGVRTIGLAGGGWVRGGSGVRDDVPIPNYGGSRNPLVAMGGEFMVRRGIAQANRWFFDEMDRTGRFPRIPQTAPAIVNAGHTTVVHHWHQERYEPTINQLPSQSARDVVNEFDRLLPLADVGRSA